MFNAVRNGNIADSRSFQKSSLCDRVTSHIKDRNPVSPHDTIIVFKKITYRAKLLKVSIC